MDVALHRREHDPLARPAGLVRLHVRLEDGDGLLHHPRALDHLGQEHPPVPEAVPHHPHAVHQGALDHGECGRHSPAGLVGVPFDVVEDAVHHGVGQPLGDGAPAPRVVRRRPLPPGAGPVGDRQEPLRGVAAAGEDDVFDPLPERRLDLVIDGEPARVHDPHVEPGRDGVVQEDRVHRLPDALVAAEGEGEVGDAPRDQGTRGGGPDSGDRVEELDGVAVVLGDAGGDGEDVRVEDDVLGRKARPFGQQPVGAPADGDLAGGIHRLSLLVERHHDDGGAEPADPAGGGEEGLFTVLERQRVDHPLAGKRAEPGLDDLEARAVHHDREPRDVGLHGDQPQEPAHGGLGLEEALVHVHVEQVGAARDLVPRHGDRRFEPVVPDQAGEAARTGHVGALAHHQERRLRPYQRLGAGEAESRGGRGRLARPGPVHRAPDRADVVRGRAAAAADEVDETVRRESAQRRRGDLRRLVVAAEFVREPGVRDRADRNRGEAGEELDDGPHRFGADRAVHPGGGHPRVLDRDPEGLGVLSGEIAPPLIHRREGNEEPGVPRRLGDGVPGSLERRLGVQRVETGLDEQQVGPSRQETRRLFPVGVPQRVPGNGPEGGVGDVGRHAQGAVRGAHGAQHEAVPAGGAGDPARGLRGAAVDFESASFEPVVEEGDGVRVERVRGEGIRAGGEVEAMHLLDQLRPGQGQDVVEPLERPWMFPEQIAPKARLVEALGLQHGADGPVEDHDALGDRPQEPGPAQVRGMHSRPEV